MKKMNKGRIKLACNWCQYPKVTDELWLVTSRGRDYLVCEFHITKHNARQRRRDAANKSKNSELLYQ